MDKLENLIPKLSIGIEFNKLSDNEYIMSNSFHRHYLKINKETYNLLSVIDGNRNLSEICSIFNSTYGKNISEKILHELLYSKFIHYGVLTGFESQIKKYEKPPYLKLSFIIINENILSKIVEKFYFLFNKKIALPLIAIFFIIICTLLLININIYKSFNLQDSLIYFLIIMTTSVTFHEIGHATSTSYFGAKHGGIGGGFYLFTPVFYADVTDVWRLKKKQRIIVNLSGIYFELIFCSILSIVGFWADNYTLLIISLVVFVYSLFNLNPFLRSDGYWILSDLTNKPNLFYHSIDKVKDLFKIFRGSHVKWSKIDFILLGYGLVTISFIGVFLYYILIKNPNSVIFFPKNLIQFFKNIFDSSYSISLNEYGKIVVPLIFLLLVFRLIKEAMKKYTCRHITKLEKK